ncbi:MAG: hypothetical protein HC851_18805 [Acaryochloris sp. RU_4_1]|nr:hypothetical protein [Acaryochloris sp. RU_4_1]
MSDTHIYNYPGKDIDVTWDQRLCIHIGECGRAKGELFVGGRNPWCQPNLVSSEEVVDVVGRCPTGALTYQHKVGGSPETSANTNTVVVSYNGPLFVRGDLDIDGATEDMTGVKFRTALCRCGQSEHKPFCDNSHEKVEFQDYGAVGETGQELNQTGGKLTIKRVKDGPLLLSGNVTMIASSGREAWHGTHTALCRCGASKNKPFCDGSHQAAGFVAD